MGVNFDCLIPSLFLIMIKIQSAVYILYSKLLCAKSLKMEVKMKTILSHSLCPLFNEHFFKTVSLSYTFALGFKFAE